MFIMVADRRHQEKTFRIEKKYCEIQKNISESKKKENIKLKSRKKFQNREKYFRIKKSFVLLQKSRKNLEFNDFEFNEPPS